MLFPAFSTRLCSRPEAQRRACSQRANIERVRGALSTGLALLAEGQADESLRVLEGVLEVEFRDDSLRESLWLAIGDAESAVNARRKVRQRSGSGGVEAPFTAL